MLDRLTIERLAASEGTMLVALSGGGDSVALLHLLVEEFGASRLRAAVVDHALREGSAEDAQHARGFAEALNVSADVLRLSWQGKQKRSQESARAARYAALCDQARDIGAAFIAVAHTRDDQAETVLLRAARGSSWRGLAGMRAIAPVPFWPQGRGLFLARPLLNAQRSALREWLRERSVSWIEDPANINEAFARVRARRKLEALCAKGFDPIRLAMLAERLAAHATELDRAARRLIRDAVAFRDDEALIMRALWRGDEAVRQRALSALVTAAGGAASEPPFEQVASLEAQMVQLDFKAATLGGAWLKSAAGGIAIRRDRGALEGRADGAEPLAQMELPSNAERVWDRRVVLRAAEGGWRVIVEAGKPQLARGEERRPLEAANAHWLLGERTDHLLGGG